METSFSRPARPAHSRSASPNGFLPKAELALWCARPRSMSWSTAILPLAGVALGSTGTLVGQYLSTRVEARREKRAYDGAQRTERKEAIMEFLSAAQQAELLSDQIDSGEHPEDSEVRDRVHALWLAKKLPELVCSPSTAQAAHDYTLALHKILRGEASPTGSATKRDLRYAFLEAARQELGTTSGSLRRSFNGNSRPNPQAPATTTDPDL